MVTHFSSQLRSNGSSGGSSTPVRNGGASVLASRRRPGGNAKARADARPTGSRRERGALNVDMLVALAIFVTAMLPLGYGWVQEQRVLRSHYWHAVAMELVDGEMEILVAGEHRAWRDGTHTYPIMSAAAKNLPPGKFTLTRTGQTLRLEWIPEKRASGGHVVREVVVK